LRFDGTGVRLDTVEIAKGAGVVTGAAYVGWDSTYSFNADGRRIPVEQIAAFNYPKAPLAGVAQFTAAGSATFDMPRYTVRFRIADLTVGEEPVGQVTGSLAVRGRELSGDLDLASPRLAVTGSGRIALTSQAAADLTFRFHDSSLDPYVRVSVPNALDAINGSITFDARGIRLDDLSATLDGGRVQFGGRIGFDGYMPGDLNVTVRGEDMHLRYPEGIRSVVDADLALRGRYTSPTLGGTVTVKSAVWNRRIDTPGSIFDLASRRSAAAAVPAAGGDPLPASVPLRFDLQIVVPSTLRIDNTLALV